MVDYEHHTFARSGLYNYRWWNSSSKSVRCRICQHNLFWYVRTMIENIVNYVDAGTGSMLLYAIAGALLSVVFILKTYWWRLREKIAKKVGKK